MDSINPELILNLFKMLSEYPYYFSTSSKLSAVTISFTCVHNGSKSFLTVSKSKAYEIVRQLNKELKEKGLITVAARVSKAYFYERMCYSKE